MLQDLFEKPFAITRHRSTLFGPHIETHIGELRAKGYDPKTLRNHVFLITWFGEFLAERRIRVLARVTESHVAAFVEHHRAVSKQKRAPVRFVVSELLDHLERIGVRRSRTEKKIGLLENFYLSLVRDKGLKPNSVCQYQHFIGKFLGHLRIDGSRQSLSQLTPRHLDTFIVECGRSYSRRSMASICCVVRGLLRYLYERKVVSRDLADAVLRPRFYALERIPCGLPWSTVRQLIDAVDAKTTKGMRDRAILVLLASYGVRPGEIVKLRLEDIDWRRGVIQFQRCKAGRPLSFPLLQEAGEALVTYLKLGRPHTDAREVFVRDCAPYVPLSRGSVVSIIVRGYFIKAGIESDRKGAYVIRHSLAVNLVREKQPLKTVSDVLGHRDPHVAYQYTKLSLDDLHGVALDVKEVLP